MQALIDQSYRGNRKVNLSQMPDQNKLILANVSGRSPDVAIGVDHWIPYDFASRSAALDLRQFSEFTQVAVTLLPERLSLMCLKKGYMDYLKPKTFGLLFTVVIFYQALV
jgi:hypothetical protein